MLLPENLRYISVDGKVDVDGFERAKLHMACGTRAIYNGAGVSHLFFS